MSTITAVKFGASLESILEAARKRIQVAPEELTEARDRRDKILGVLMNEFPGSETYVNGSVAHGDALNPLTDVDVGVVVFGAEGTFGPGKKGPSELMNRASDAIRDALRDEYENLVVTVEGQRRAVWVQFGDPVNTNAKDFTADVLVTLDNLTGDGLYIPEAIQGTWDRAHPQKHTAMVLAANKASDGTYTHAVRLLKHWCRTNGKPMCSWNIKALALGCLTESMPTMDALQTWFTYALDELAKGPTKDPAQVVEKPIELNETTSVVLNRLRKASRHLVAARRFEDEGYPLLAWQELAEMFNDDEMLPNAPKGPLLAEETRRRAAGVGGTAALSIVEKTKPTQSWRP